jgi:hypothetical protein
MKTEFVYRFIPVPIVAGTGLFIGQSYGFFVRIDPHFIDDEGFVAHELVHVRQFYRTLGLHFFLYYLCKGYRYKAELEAYKAQVATGKYTKEIAAHNLRCLYGFNIDINKIRADLD